MRLDLEAFTPKIVTVLREGYGPRQLRADAVAGLTVAIIALPLAMALAIASGASHDKGLITAIVGGPAWLRAWVTALDKLTKAHIRHFKASDEALAWQWLDAQPKRHHPLVS